MLQIAEQKDAAIRGLSNYMFMEAQRMAKVLLHALHALKPRQLVLAVVSDPLCTCRRVLAAALLTSLMVRL